MNRAKPLIAVSTWSLHRTLGVVYADAPGLPANGAPLEKYGRGEIDLLDLPAALRARGYARVEICHFNIRSRDAGYLSELKASLADSSITLQTLLIDDGDISHPDNSARDAAWCGEWIDAAAALGADCARVIGGKQKPSREALERSAAALRLLAKRGSAQGVKIITENWLDLLSGPDEVLYVLDAAGDDLGLIADTWNWRGESKYAGLAAIFPRATSCHAKCNFPSADVMDLQDYSRCLGIARAANFSGPFTLIYDGPGDDEWECLARMREVVGRKSICL